MREPTPETAGELSGGFEPPDLLAHLEQRVRRLVERYTESKRAVDDLRLQIREREQMITELNARLVALEKRRGEASERLGGVIARIERMERDSDRRDAGQRDAERP